MPWSGGGSGATIPIFGPSGPGHSAGQVPDPGSTAGTTRFLREDATFQVPAGGGATSEGPNLFNLQFGLP